MMVTHLLEVTAELSKQECTCNIRVLYYYIYTVLRQKASTNNATDDDPGGKAKHWSLEFRTGDLVSGYR